MVQEMQQRIYLPDSEFEDDKEVKESSLESGRSSSSGISDNVSVDDLRKMLSSSSLFSQSQTKDKDVSWKRLKRTKLVTLCFQCLNVCIFNFEKYLNIMCIPLSYRLIAVLKMLSIRRREMRNSRTSSTGKSLPTIDESELISNHVKLTSRLSSSSFSSYLSFGSSEGK